MNARSTLVFAALLGCGDRSEGTLRTDVAASFAPCDANEIASLATKHAFQLAFRECGSNEFTAFRWSPDGTQLYLQLALTPYVLDAAAPGKPTVPVATTTPIGPATWVAPGRLVVPVGPGPDDVGNRLAIADLAQKSVFHVPLALDEVRETQATTDPTRPLILGRRADTWGLLRVDTATGELTPAFPWLADAPDTFTWQPALDLAVLGRGETVELRRGTDGTRLGRWPLASRGSLHPDGRYLMLEHLGPPDTDGARPPTLSWVDLTSGRRWRFEAIQGDRFQWYEAAGHYAAFFLWGFEGRQVRRNVTLGALDGRFLSIDKGRDVTGVVPMPEGEDPEYRRAAP